MQEMLSALSSYQVSGTPRAVKAQRIVVVLVSAMMVFSLLFYVATHPKQQEQFFELSVLGPNLKAEGYYPTEHGKILVGENVRWFIAVSNHKSSSSLVRLTIGLGVPEESPRVAFPESGVETVGIYHRILQEGETWTLPLNWRVISASSNSEGKVRVCMALNNIVVQPAVVSEKGKNFRIVIGLWSVEPSTQTYQLRSWLQVWFSVSDYSEGRPAQCA